MRFGMLALVGLAALALTACENNRAGGSENDVGRASEYLREHGYKATQIAYIDYLGFYDVNTTFCGASTDATREHDARIPAARVYAFHAAEGSGLLCIRNGGAVDLLSPTTAPGAPVAEPAKP